MNQRHEVLFLNDNRSYVLVGDTWYDTHRDLAPQVGQSFLIGKIDQVLSYDEYKASYPESKEEIYFQVTDKTISGGFLRRVVGSNTENSHYDKLVRYAVNPAQPQVGSKGSKESSLD